MSIQILKRNPITRLLLTLSLAVPLQVFAADDNYSSQLMNQSKQAKTAGYKLVKTRVWPESACVIDSGQQLLNPGESAVLKVKKVNECDEAGVGYSMYQMADSNNEHLLGYVSHRFRDGKFSLQISMFCEGDKCIFRDLSPLQIRK